MLRSWARLSRALPGFVAPRSGVQAAVTPTGVLRHSSHKIWLTPSENSIDRAVPNSSWSQEMLHHFNRYIEMTKDGSWQKLPSYRSFYEHFPEGHERCELQKRRNRLFLRSIDEEGMGFEFAHGGSLATLLDSTLGGCAICVNRRVLTANLSINYKNPVALGSVVLAESRLDKIEGRKIFVSGEIRSADRQILHAEATALFIQLESSILPQEKTVFE
ncbi:acyl-coenzyme A thioesterase THEM4 isoform X2 [Python bivittatus]|uniref:Acyl-coenzyme A thioesterase THEM4 n=1 Tax=Python bivittatus TaxID=176946 RepID=A0A9F2N9I0_PYTBI|nr:acyl-coenzyme A thioesterase THEM4 isoform X2 [Python bivittatus]